MGNGCCRYYRYANPTRFDYAYGYLDQKQAHNFYPTHLWENDRWDSLENSFFYVHNPLDPKTATDADFEAFKGKDYAPAKMTEKALGFIDKNKNKPFFLYLPYTLPHVSLQAPDEYVKNTLVNLTKNLTSVNKDMHPQNILYQPTPP